MEEEQKAKKFLKSYFLSGAISLAIGAIIFCLFFFIKGIGVPSALDGCGYATIALLALAGLIYVARNGFFDIFAYGFKQLGSQIFSKRPSEYNDFPGYKENKRTVRKKKSKYYISVFLVGIVFLIATVILYIIAY